MHLDMYWYLDMRKLLIYFSLMDSNSHLKRLLVCLLADGRLLALFQIVIDTELRKRQKLDHVNTIDDVVQLIQASTNIIVLVGAGSRSQYVF
jgi:hypothetical protein